MSGGRGRTVIKDELGLVHIYCGNGKGKTTGAMGLALRALGRGLRVVVVQFLKGGDSGEITALTTLLGARVFTNPGLAPFRLSETEKISCRDRHAENFRQACALCKSNDCDLLVLDEIIGAISRGLFDEAVLVDWLKTRPANIEVALTGRDPSYALLEIADYVSRIEKIKHPLNNGIAARFGVEK